MFIWFTGCSPSLRDTPAVKATALSRCQQRNALHWLVIKLMFSYLPYTEPRLSCLGMMLPTVGRALLHELAVGEMPHKHASRLVLPMWVKLTTKVGRNDTQ